MKIVIPTYKRPTTQKTLELFLSCGISPVLVGRTIEDIPVGYTNFLLHPEPGIRSKRQFILDRFFLQNKKFMMIDDDLKIYKKGEDGKLTTFFHFTDFVSECDAISDLYGISGVHPYFMINQQTEPWRTSTKIYRVMMFNPRLIPKKLNLKYRLETGQDHDIHLQYLTQNQESAVTCRFAHRDKENAPGGCSEWRTDVTQDVDALVKLWPNYVTKMKNGRPRIQFKKAYKESKPN